MSLVYLGLGSNVERESHIRAGLDALAPMLQGLRCSPVFESRAVGIKSGPFYNMVVCGRTELPLAELDRRLKCIEADNGRYAPGRKGLPLDIDVLLYDDRVGNFDGLVLPRPEILRNAFVLWPLALLAPDLRHPGEGVAMGELWARAVIDQQLAPVSFSWRGAELTPAVMLQAP
jgi:2-amino-4-hydroxy-6-hydroxymethyldihydropteridine diphosphokinase